MNIPGKSALVLVLFTIFSMSAFAEKSPLVSYKALHPDTALKLAKSALDACRKEGYQTAVSVVDRMGVLQVTLRDQYAGSHTPDTAYRKAWTAASFHTNTTELAGVTQAGQPQSGVRHVTNALMLGGGLIIEADGSLIGAIGVSGAPGGDLDDQCAKKGLASIEEELFL